MPRGCSRGADKKEAHMQREIELDDIVDYRAAYAGAVEQAEIHGDSLTGLCPFHKDKNPSFSVDLKTGKYHCFACGAEGNYLSFYAHQHGLEDTKEAYKRILEEHGRPCPTGRPAVYTVDDYAAEKRLPAAWLKDTLHLSSAVRKDGAQFIKIPYFDAAGKQRLYRLRFPKGSAQRFGWSHGARGNLLLYGEWRLQEAAAAGYAVLVEGESDAQTLWHLGVPALGVPGAAAYRAEWTERLTGIPKLYLHIEPDSGGKTFRELMIKKLAEGGYAGELYEFSCAALGKKDPSELYLSSGEAEARRKLATLVGTAKRIDVAAELIKEAIPGAPKNLRQPAGWMYDAHGIFRIDEKTMQPLCVCRTPIILTRRLKSTETGDEKIEVGFLRDGQWHTASFARSTIFQSKSITALADLGCTVTSENAKQVVRFLEALEAENIDIIETVESTSAFGWQTRGRFLPGAGDGLVLDIEPSLSGWAAAYCREGSLNDWTAQMAPHRARYRFRFILAAAFTAPLLRILRQRIFFVYNWGGSKGGKTAALKAALSAWGDPERLMVSFNATQVALERIAGFFCDLPLGIDERQLAGNKQDMLEKIVYMLASGTGRARGSKTGGLQALKTWRTVVLATGEEPIAGTHSMTGVMTRMIEVVGAPFDCEADASLMHQTAARNCGHAGPAFISWLLGQKESDIVAEYDEMLRWLKDLVKAEASSHLASVAAVALADSLISRVLFGETRDTADMEAADMAMQIFGDLKANEVPDVNVSACRFISDWLAMNPRNFGRETADSFDKDSGAVFYGWLTSFGDAYILPTPLKDALEREGYNYRKTVKYLVDQRIVCAGQNENRQTILKKQGEKVLRVYRLNLDKLNRHLDDEKSGLEELESSEETPFDGDEALER